MLYSVFQFHMPPVRRLPSILWLRIKNHLKEYIVEKEADDTAVIFWYHRRFVEVALNKYVTSLEKSESDALFQNVLDFYNETWNNVQKPFKVNDYLKKKLKLSDEGNLADRLISSQPIEFMSDDGTIKYNKRKLACLPNFLLNQEQIPDC